MGEGELEMRYRQRFAGENQLRRAALSGDNDYSGGTIISDGARADYEDNADSLGTGAVASSGVLQSARRESWKPRQRFAGETGSGELTLSGDNDYSAAPFSDGTLICR